MRTAMYQHMSLITILQRLMIAKNWTQSQVLSTQTMEHGIPTWSKEWNSYLAGDRFFSFPCRKMHLVIAKFNISTTNNISFSPLCFCQLSLKKLLVSNAVMWWMFRAAVTELEHLSMGRSESGSGIWAFSGVPFTPRTEITIFLAVTVYKMATYWNLLSSFYFNKAC